MSNNDILPQSEEAEAATLGALFTQTQTVQSVLTERGITPKHFAHPGRRAIYDEVLHLETLGRNVDAVTVTQSARDRGTLDICGGPAGITEPTSYPTTANLKDHLDILVEKFTLREIIATCRETDGLARDESNDPAEVLETLAKRVAEIAGASRKKKRKTFKQLLSEKIGRMQNDDADSDQIPTGYDLLDRNSPLRLGSMPLVSGERKGGKSTFAVNLAVNVILTDRQALYFSLEDQSREVVDRIVGKVSQVPMARHFAKSMTEGDWRAMTPAIQSLAKQNIDIRDDVFDLVEIVAVCRQWKTENPDGALIVIDYAQLVRVRIKNGNREQEIALISRTIRLLAMELNTAIALLCQLNSDGATRESKALENDCTAMWKIVKTGEEEEENTKRFLVIPFQRNGAANIAIPLSFNGATASFDNIREESPFK